jgi:hypothetical protein
MSIASEVPGELSERQATLRRIRKLSTLLDTAFTIPGTSFKIGLDPLIGLLPGGGDLITTILSAYLLIEAHKLGVPSSLMLRMIANVIIDALIGAIPVLGDIFDFAWRSNTRNLKLLEDFLRQS